MPRLQPSETTISLTENESNWLWEHLYTQDMSGDTRRAAGIVSRLLTRLEMAACPAWDNKPWSTPKGETNAL